VNVQNSPSDKSQAEKHRQCLDLFHVAALPESGVNFKECAILVEVWETGGLLQTESAVEPGTLLLLGDQEIPAKVQSCQQDEFGFLLTVSILSSPWFPDRYSPPHLM
jgi:hypothetical protein